MGLFPPELRDKNDLWGWVRRLGTYLRSTVLRSGRGILLAQTDSGTTVSLANHSADHLPGAKDEIKFQTLEITFTNPNDPEDVKRIIFNPAGDDFLADRIFSVNAEGTFTGWRTMLDLLDGLSGFSAGKALVVNATEDGLEFGDAGGILPADVVKESTTTPFQAGKLVLASATAHELLGTLIGINLAGATYLGYLDTMVSTDARVAQIADSRFNAKFPQFVITGGGWDGQIAVFDGDGTILGSQSLTTLLNQLLGTATPSKIVYTDADGIKTGTLQEADPDAVRKDGSPNDFNIAYFYGGNVIKGLAQPAIDSVLAMDGGTIGLRWKSLADVGGLPSGTVGQIIYHSGTEWVVLAKPASTGYLSMTSAGSPSWAAGVTVQSSGGTGASLVTADGKIKTIYGD